MKKAFWTENDTFYAEVYPLNSASAKGKKAMFYKFS
jgi:hypothetical protein